MASYRTSKLQLQSLNHYSFWIVFETRETNLEIEIDSVSQVHTELNPIPSWTVVTPSRTDANWLALQQEACTFQFGQRV